MASKQSVVLVTVTYPDDLTSIFDEVGAKGYDLKRFDLASQDALLAEASDIAQTDSPIALLCSDIMKPDRFSMREIYKGKYNGNELAAKLNLAVGDTPTLSIIYSSEVVDNSSQLQEGHQQVVTIKKAFRPEEEANKIIESLNGFYSKFQVK